MPSVVRAGKRCGNPETHWQIFLTAPPFPTGFTCAWRAAMAELEQLLAENKEWLERDGNVVRCRLSGHAMPLRADAITQYMRRVCTQ